MSIVSVPILFGTCAYLFKIALCLRCYVKAFFHHGIFQIIWVSEDIFHLPYSAVTWRAAEGKCSAKACLGFGRWGGGGPTAVLRITYAHPKYKWYKGLPLFIFLYFFRSLVGVLVSHYCCNKLAWTYSLRQHTFFSTLQGVRSQKSVSLGSTQGFGQAVSFWKLEGENPCPYSPWLFQLFPKPALHSLLVVPSSLLQSEKHNISFPLWLLLTPSLSDFDSSCASFVRTLVISGHKQITGIIFPSQVP